MASNTHLQRQPDEAATSEAAARRAPVTVLIADDDSLFRRALRELLEADPRFEVVGEAQDGSHAAQLTAALRPQLVLMDYEMPILDGPAATAMLKRHRPEVCVVFLTGTDDPRAFERAVDAGAAAFIAKSQLVDALDKSLHALASHRVEGGAAGPDGQP